MPNMPNDFVTGKLIPVMEGGKQITDPDKGERWLFFATLPGKKRPRKQRIFWGTEKQAVRHYNKFIKELTNDYINNKIPEDIVPQNISKITFGEHLRAFLHENPNDYNDKTWGENNRIAEKHVIPLIGDVPLFKLTPPHFERYKSMKLAGTKLTGKDKLKTCTINKHLALISSSLKYAANKGYITFNPMRLVSYIGKKDRDGTTNHAEVNCLGINEQDDFMSKLYTLYSFRGIRKAHTDEEIKVLVLNHFGFCAEDNTDDTFKYIGFTEEEISEPIRMFVKLLKQIGFSEKEITLPKFQFKLETYMLYPLLYLAFSTGMRLSELLALEWDDIDFDGKTIHICKSSHYGKKKDNHTSGHFLNTTKNKDSRTIDITDEDISLLKKHKVDQTMRRQIYDGKYQDNNLVFSKKNGAYLRNDTMSKEFTKFAHRLGYDVSFHSTRHFHITLLLTIGEPVVIVAERVGHKKPSMTSDTYVHVKKGHYINLGESYHISLKKVREIAEEKLSQSEKKATQLMHEMGDI